MPKPKPAVRKNAQSHASSITVQEVRTFAKNLTPESARRFLVDAGIVTPKGKLTQNYR